MIRRATHHARILPRAFTLVEILIVVVILGILAALVVPSFAEATDAARETTTVDQLGKVRRALAVYRVTHNELPSVTAGDGTWGELLSGGYLREAPINPWVSGPNRRVILLRETPDTSYQTTHGWIFDAAGGEAWAGGFDGADEPLPRP